ncbi:MAG: NYN domain-containing protein [Deltaproteobacteria bacterium]|nr:NYN domain-containing protein [Deltaproteobacteria bacterium]MBW2661141.1 NYN domain-containing protein [Deltaproteobacteria bacterium]
MHIIIDGYNLIRQSGSLSDLDGQELQLGRDALIEKLAAYKKIKHHRITVVFDGANAPSFSQRRQSFKGIKIRFSRNGELADTVIKRMAVKEREMALIVSSDLDIVNCAESCGAATISSPVFEQKIAMAESMSKSGSKMEEDNSGWIPTTKKKGPSRRLSKKVRRSMVKIRKL